VLGFHRKAVRRVIYRPWIREKLKALSHTALLTLIAWNVRNNGLIYVYIIQGTVGRWQNNILSCGHRHANFVRGDILIYNCFGTMTIIFCKIIGDLNFSLGLRNEDTGIRNVRRICCMASFLRSRQFLLYLFFDVAVGGDMFLQNVSCIQRSTRRYIPEHRTLQVRGYFFFLFLISW
jgi:hypothetical protein